MTRKLPDEVAIGLPTGLENFRRLSGEMNIGFHNYYDFCNHNKMFMTSFSPVGDELFYSTMLLGRRLKDLGHTVSTLDAQPLESFDKVFFIDYPTLFNSYFRKLLERRFPEMHLMLLESPIIRPDNYDPRHHAMFKSVMTWKRDLCTANPYKYRLFPIANKHRPNCFSKKPFAERKLCTLINSYMTSNRKGELYSERIRAVRWFETHALSDFDLIGTEWDMLFFPQNVAWLNLPLRFAYRRIAALRKLRFRRYRSFIGPNRKSKHMTLHEYRFCIAYENSIEPDYISEKIFDCFYSGCVPVYMGAPNITDYIPQNAFIDWRHFRSYDRLYRYLSSMSEGEFNSYLAAIHAFIHSDNIKAFTAEAFVDKFVATYVSNA